MSCPHLGAIVVCVGLLAFPVCARAWSVHGLELVGGIADRLITGTPALDAAMAPAVNMAGADARGLRRGSKSACEQMLPVFRSLSVFIWPAPGVSLSRARTLH